MSDFSYFSLFTAGLACLVPLASAAGSWTQPTGDAPKGNPISQPGLNSVVPAGENFTVTWNPTTSGTVTLVLLKGPASNAVPQYAIASKIENSGSFVWSPSTDLAPADTGYGLELIVDATGQYQYTTQFGISNADYKPGAASASASSALASASSHWSSEWSSATHSLTEAYNSATSALASATASTTATATVTAFGNATAPYPTSGVVASTGGLPANSSIVYPTGSLTVPSSLLTTASATASSSSAGGASATTSVAAVQTGAAAGMATSFAGLVVAAGVAVFAL